MNATYFPDEYPDEPQPGSDERHDAITDEVGKSIASTFDDTDPFHDGAPPDWEKEKKEGCSLCDIYTFFHYTPCFLCELFAPKVVATQYINIIPKISPGVFLKFKNIRSFVGLPILWTFEVFLLLRLECELHRFRRDWVSVLMRDDYHDAEEVSSD